MLDGGNIPSYCSSTQCVQNSGQTVTHDVVVIGNIHEITLKFCDNAHHYDAHEGDVSRPVSVLRNNTASVFPSRCEDLLLNPEWKVDILQVMRNVGWVVPALIYNMGFVMSRFIRVYIGFLIIYGKKILFPLGAKSLFSN